MLSTETDYVFWKYDKLKDLCSAPPKYYEATYTSFGTNKQYLCKPYYRFETRIINQLKEIRDMPRIQKFKNSMNLDYVYMFLTMEAEEILGIYV